MGGEVSKRNGEFGEERVEKFLELIGWNNPRKGVPIKCINQDNHNKSIKSGSHGIDFGYTYISPLIDGELIDLSISSKFTAGNYPNSPNAKFKEYIFDLSTTIECYDGTEKKAEILRGFRNFEKIKNIGVLFWLTNSKEIEKGLFEKISTSRFDDELSFETIYVVDDYRYNFITKSIKFGKNFFPGGNLDFHYPDTGKNILPIYKKSYGQFLPVEYINSSILLLRLENPNSNENILMISVLDNFHKDDFKMLLGLSQNLSKAWASKTIICFPDYNFIDHGEEVKSIISQFEEVYIKKNIEVLNYNE
ncbi:hypothetical protein [uncultured Flavobacterium sp.]|uniref:GapS4a family protein n=1 Tax=uncultured Flavobacterium sp. TaxID=165435 RepID=UPI0025FCE265|nr:hypothetical protein [uncultured Flavobacterium sp.]